MNIYCASASVIWMSAATAITICFVIDTDLIVLGFLKNGARGATRFARASNRDQTWHPRTLCNATLRQVGPAGQIIAFSALAFLARTAMAQPLS